MIVYIITNTVNGKRYVGQTVFMLEKRWKQHQKSPRCHALHNAIEKYGAKNFIIEPIIEVPTIELLNEFEAEYIKKYCTLAPNGYNLTEGGRAPRHNVETRAKMSRSRIGLEKSVEHCRRISEGKKGAKRSEETKRKISETLTGSHYGRNGGIKTNHIRWHVKRGITNPNCGLCK